MNLRRSRPIVVLGLILTLIAGATGSASADENGPYQLSYPWVPNGAMLGSLGPFYGAVTITNLEVEPVTIYYQVTASGWGPEQTVPLQGFASVTLSAAQMGVPSPGGGVVVWSKRQSNQHPARLAGVAKQTAPVAPEIPQMEARTSAAHQVVDGYTGLTENDEDYQLVLPIVQTNSGWNTAIRVTNLDDITSEITVEFRPTVGVPLFRSAMVASGATATFDLLASGIPVDFVGAAIITSDPNGPLIALAERYKPSTNMLLINTARMLDSCESTHFASLVLKNYNSWNTGVAIINASGIPNEVAITYYSAAGDNVGANNLSIPAWGMDFDYQPADGVGDGFVGSAVITGTQPLCAMVDEVKYTGGGQDVGHAMSYATTASSAMVGQQLVLPLAQKGSPSTGLGDTTGIQVFNPGDSQMHVGVVYVNTDGNQVKDVELFIPAKGSDIAYAMSIDILEGFQGSAVVIGYSGDGRFVAVSNNVNYAVGYDGSTSFPLVFGY